MEELERRVEETRLREAESRRLTEELEEARTKMEENQRALEEALRAPPPAAQVIVLDHGPADDDDKTSELSMHDFLSCAY